MELEQRTAQLRMQSSERAMPFLCRQMEDLQVRRHVHAERAIQESQQLILQLKAERASAKQHSQYLAEDLAAARQSCTISVMPATARPPRQPVTRHCCRSKKCFMQAGDLTPIPRFGTVFNATLESSCTRWRSGRPQRPAGSPADLLLPGRLPHGLRGA